jgi:hypothetical protein
MGGRKVTELETTRFAAPFAARIDIAAATALAAIHCAALGRGDVTAALS